MFNFFDILLSNYLGNINGIFSLSLVLLLIAFLKFPSWLSVLIMGPIGYFMYSFFKSNFLQRFLVLQFYSSNYVFSYFFIVSFSFMAFKTKAAIIPDRPFPPLQ